MTVLVTVVGVPEDGCVSLNSRAVAVVEGSRVLAGHERLMHWFPQCDQKRLSYESGYQNWFNSVVDEAEEGNVVVLASGDPLFFGITQALIKRLGANSVRTIASPSSMQLACAEIGVSWQDMKAISLHGRHKDQIKGLVSQMQQGDKFCLLTDSNNTPQKIANHLKRFSQGHWQIWVAENLGAADQRVREFKVDQLCEQDIPFAALNVLVLIRTQESYWGGFGRFADDEDFEKRMPKRGLITKQSVRHVALGELKLEPHHIVWDIGTGSGSIAIESAKQCPLGSVFTLESNADCYSSIQANIQAHATDNVTLIPSKAPQGLEALPTPDSVFVGGSRGEMNIILDHCWQALISGGRIVVSAVTLESVSEILTWAKLNQRTFKVQQIAVSQGVPLASYTRYQAENPIHLFTFKKSTTDNNK
ncbi:precorrin-6y C5,15-methyltransferase (decarboxylating) subunit CbiE [Vibrio sp. SCSIO 43136]|uniref:precorrin-6y C5,15-methyltransferase (decarboxylating) subunit CbiE n=1 Tax=Vibrio sp. SCSIO 43136 TaxID=2819101 RepID=UPI002075F3CC|nr:precorrin-6y C5,15-methyltransferase (decarboxylating) subunit CbiE [Vibrio sp. SCSIO 43136]USD66876.1 precorrin-6y C5,15-methyltransferase (decarboxylating) subunit CbiE [Vibrio sp. SCSIO 43136]